MHVIFLYFKLHMHFVFQNVKETLREKNSNNDAMCFEDFKSYQIIRRFYHLINYHYNNCTVHVIQNNVNATVPWRVYIFNFLSEKFIQIIFFTC